MGGLPPDVLGVDPAALALLAVGLDHLDLQPGRAQAAEALKSGTLVVSTAHAVDEDRGVPFLAMEYLEGQSLDQRLKTGRWSSFWDPAGFLTSMNGLDTASLFAHPMRVVPDAGTMPRAAQTEPARPYRADTGEATFDPDRRLFLVHAPAAAGRLTVPLLAINGDLYPTEIAAIRKVKADFDAVIMKHMGHYPMLERPDEFNRHVADVVGALEARAAKVALPR